MTLSQHCSLGRLRIHWNGHVRKPLGALTRQHTVGGGRRGCAWELCLGAEKELLVESGYSGVLIIRGSMYCHFALAWSRIGLGIQIDTLT